MCELLLINKIVSADPFTKSREEEILAIPSSPFLSSDSPDYMNFSTDSLDRVLFSLPASQCDNTREYTDQMCSFMQNNEAEAVQRRDFQIPSEERCVAVDWMLWVCFDFNLLDETFFLSVSIFDKMIQDEEFEISKIQLLGAVSVWIASKLEETQIPSVEDFVVVCNNAFTIDEFCQYEKVVLKRCNYNVIRPTAESFTSAYLSQIPVDPNFVDCANMFMYASVFHSELSFTLPSHTGLAAVTLSKLMMDYQMNLVVIPRSLPFIDERELDRAALLLLNATKVALSNPNGSFSTKFSDFLHYNYIDFDVLTTKVKQLIADRCFASALES